MSAKQFAVVIAVFNKLDADGSGLISIDDLKNGFDFSGCVKASDERKAQIFMAMFDCNQDGKVKNFRNAPFLKTRCGIGVVRLIYATNVQTSKQNDTNLRLSKLYEIL